MDNGFIQKAAVGSYFLSTAVKDPVMLDLAATCQRMPRALVCLMSAAHLCGLVDAPPERLWIALPVGVHGGKPGRAAAQIIRWSYPGAFEIDLVKKEICGVPIWHTGSRRTIVDLMRYGARWGEPNAGILAARKFVAIGGDLRDVSAVAEVVDAPRAIVEALRTLALALA